MNEWILQELLIIYIIIYANDEVYEIAAHSNQLSWQPGLGLVLTRDESCRFLYGW